MNEARHVLGATPGKREAGAPVSVEEEQNQGLREVEEQLKAKEAECIDLQQACERVEEQLKAKEQEHAELQQSHERLATAWADEKQTLTDRLSSEAC